MCRVGTPVYLVNLDCWQGQGHPPGVYYETQTLMQFLPFSRNPSECKVDETYSNWSFSKPGSDAISSQSSRYTRILRPSCLNSAATGWRSLVSTCEADVRPIGRVSNW